ncbi:MAG: AsmA family protein [Candidatus Rokubacteria bacterium]|nr:AsmA family protein [Candidatus Rokubacteria bacterium]
MKWILIVVGALIVLAIVLLAAIPYLVDLPQLRAYVAQSAAHALGRPVKFSELSLSVLPLPAVVLKDLEIAEDPRFGDTPFLKVGEGRFRLGLAPLLSRRIEFTELALERPRVELIQDGSGRWNVASLGAAAEGGPATSRAPGRPAGAGAAAPLPVISRLRIVDGALHYQVRPAKGPATDYRVEGMKLTLQGLGSGAPVGIEGEAQVNPGAVSVKLDGTLSPPPGAGTLTAAPLKADISLDAKDMSNLTGFLLGSSPALSGPVKGKLALTGTLGRLALAGQLDSGRLTLTERRPDCPPPETRRLTLESVRFPLSYDPARLQSAPLRANLSGGSIAVSLNLAFEPTPLLSLKEITLKALPLAPLLVDYLCQGYAVSGPLDLTGELSARPANFLSTMNGQGQLKIGAGKVVGPAALRLLGGVVRVGGALSSVLNVDLPLSLSSSPLDFQSITASYRITDGRLTTQDFLYTSERMKVAAAGEYGLADGRMNFDLTMTHGRGEVKAKVTGTGDSPSIRVLPGTILRTDPEKVPGRLKKFLEGLSK